jgi:hypothetical protein
MDECQISTWFYINRCFIVHLAVRSWNLVKNQMKIFLWIFCKRMLRNLKGNLTNLLFLSFSGTICKSCLEMKNLLARISSMETPRQTKKYAQTNSSMARSCNLFSFLLKNSHFHIVMTFFNSLNKIVCFQQNEIF